ncbi:MAG TPA: ATP synthase F0 subunit B [Candidatus Baltobacteraceae bacterium]|nr:ATP synthase F0 subunit B [Candidatus Baltobacteraceae bacterium]
MLTLDGTIFVQIVNLIVFLAIMNVIFFRPVGAAIARRRAYIDGLKHDIEQLQREAKTHRGSADERRAAARREADAAIAKARVETARESDAILVAAQARAGEIAAKAQLEVEREIERAREEEPRIVDALAGEMLERALGGAA